MIIERVQGLTSKDKDDRIRCAEELGDLLEHGAPSSELEAVAASLIDAIVRESNPETREAITNTLAILASKNVGLKAPWSRLEEILDQFDTYSLQNALTALGYSGDYAYEKTVSHFQTHGDGAVREAAADALVELRASLK